MKKAELFKFRRIAALALAICMALTCVVFAKNDDNNDNKAETITINDTSYTLHKRSTCSELDINTLGATMIVSKPAKGDGIIWVKGADLTKNGVEQAILDSVKSISTIKNSEFVVYGGDSFSHNNGEVSLSKDGLLKYTNHSDWSILYAGAEDIAKNKYYYQVVNHYTAVVDGKTVVNDKQNAGEVKDSGETTATSATASWTNDATSDGENNYVYTVKDNQPTSGTYTSTNIQEPTVFHVYYEYSYTTPQQETKYTYYYRVVNHYTAVVNGKTVVDDKQNVGEVQNSGETTATSATASWTNDATSDGVNNYVYTVKADQPTSGTYTSTNIQEPTVFHVYYEYSYTTPESEPKEEPVVKKHRDTTTVKEEPVEEIPAEEVPLADVPEVLEELPAEEVPLAEAPETPAASEELDELLDEEVPLADVPTTGDGIADIIVMLLASLTIIVGYTLLARTERKKSR